MRYFKLNNQVYAFESDQLDFISDGMIEMTKDEIDKHLNPTKYMSCEEVAAHNRSLLPKISKRQFALYLYDNNMYDQVMSAIESNLRFKVEYDSVSDIERLSPTVSEMTKLLGWTDEQVDEMWEQALTL